MNRKIHLLLLIGYVATGCATAATTLEQSIVASNATMPANSIEPDLPPPQLLEVNAEMTDSESPIRDISLDSLALDEALRLAEENRPELEALRRRIGMAQGQAWQAGLWPNPVLTVGLDSYTPGGNDRRPDLAVLDNIVNVINQTQGTQFWLPSFPEPGNPDQLQRTVSVSQALPIWGTPRLARKAGGLDVQRWRHEYERTRLELRTQVKKRFSAVVFKQERLSTMVELEQTLLEILDTTRARLDAGDIAEVELIKGEADHERFVLEVESARTELDQARIELARALGDPGLSIKNCVRAGMAPEPGEAGDLLAALGDNHPQVNLWAAAQAVADAEVKVAESRRWPTPTLGVGYRHYDYSDQDTFDVSLELELPLFDRKQGEIRAARERAKHNAASIQAEKNTIEANLESTIAAYTSHQKKAAAFQSRILPKMEESLAIARLRFDAGDTSMLEVLDAYRSLAEAKLAYQEAAYSASSAYHDLEFYLPESR